MKLKITLTVTFLLVACIAAFADQPIPTIAAVDVHGNLTNKGFTLDKWLGGPQSEWKCTLKKGQTEYESEAFGPSASSITTVRGTVLNYGAGDINKVAVDFLGYLASLTYQGAEPVRAKQWVIANISRDAETTIGGVKFQLFASTPRARVLRLTKP